MGHAPGKAKCAANELAQEKNSCTSDRWVQDISETDKDAPKRFWDHVKALGLSIKYSQSFIPDQNAIIFEDNDVLCYMWEFIRG